MKSFLKRILVSVVAFSLAFNAFTMSAFADVTLNDEINDIYSHIDNEVIRSMYIQSTTYCVTDNSNNVVFTIPNVPEIYDQPSFLRSAIVKSATDCTFYPRFDTNKDEDFINRNIAGVDTLYNLCHEASEETTGMNDEDKMYYLMDFVMDNLTYDQHYSNINATSTVTFYEKLSVNSGVCSEFCNLYYILAKYIGLDARIIVGKLNGSGHSWIRVNIDGNSYDIEATKGKFTSKYMQNNTYEEKVKTDDFETNYYLRTH